jgi:hypothetical protein
MGTQAAGEHTTPGMWVARVSVLRKIGLIPCLANHPENELLWANVSRREAGVDASAPAGQKWPKSHGRGKHAGSAAVERSTCPCY